MKKLIVGVAAVGVLLALRPLVKHAKQMAAHCKEMMEGRSEPAGQEARADQHAEPVIAA